MATTSTSKSQTTAAPKQPTTTREERIERRMDFIKKYVFQLCVAVAAGITIFVLALSGIGANAFTYDDILFTVIAIYNIAIMAFPAILAFKHKQQLVPRLIIIGASIVFIWLVLPIMTRLFGVWEWAQGLWSVPFIGPFIFCWGAVILHGFAAIVLTYHKEDETPAFRTQLDELNDQVPETEKEERTARRLLNDAKAKETQSLKNRDEKKAKLEAAMTHVEAAEKQLHATQPYIRRQTLTEELRATEGSIKLLEEELEDMEQSNASPSDLDKQRGLIASAITERDLLLKQIEDVDREIETSSEQAAVNAARKEMEEPERVLAEYEQYYDDDVSDAESAQRDHTRAVAALNGLRDEIRDVESKIDKNGDDESLATRDVIFWPILWLSLAFLLYPTWYGWILVTTS